MTSAVERVLTVFLVSAATVWGLSTIVHDRKGMDVWDIGLRTSLDALWLAPLALFVCEGSPWAMAIAAPLAASVTKSFRFLPDDPEGPERPPVLSLSTSTFNLPDSSFWFWGLLSAICGALCAQTGALADFIGYPIAAAILVGISSVIWTWSFTAEQPPDNRQARPVWNLPSRMFLVLALAIVFTATGLMRYIEKTQMFGSIGVPSGSHSQGFSSSKQKALTAHQNASEKSAVAVGNAYPGIVLWPEKPVFTKLVAPAPEAEDALLMNNRTASPLVIPFNGVYLFARAPDVFPPKGSREAHGSPDMFNIQSTDQRSLSL